MSSEEDSALEYMITRFRVSELQDLLSSMRKDKHGRKGELKTRCLDLLRMQKSPRLVTKIKELYAARQATGRDLPGVGTSSSTVPVPGIRAGGASANGTNAVAVTNSSSAGSINCADAPEASGTKAVIVSSLSETVELANVVQPEGHDAMLQQVPASPSSSQPRVAPVIIPTVIRMKELDLFRPSPFVLIEPTILENRYPGDVQQCTLPFRVTPDQAKQLLESSGKTRSTEGMKRKGIKSQIMLRFCALDYLKPEQEDLLPPGLEVLVNVRVIEVVHKVPGSSTAICRCVNCIDKTTKPLDITRGANFSTVMSMSNEITVIWNSKNDFKKYAASAYIAERRSTEELLSSVVNNESQPAEFTKARITEIMSNTDDDGLHPLTSLSVSLACPIGERRMNYPCRSKACRHLQCFDAESFLQIQQGNEMVKWTCPICYVELKLEDLRLDQYFLEIIKEVPGDVGDEVYIHPDGSWEPAEKNKNDLDSAVEIEAPPRTEMETRFQLVVVEAPVVEVPVVEVPVVEVQPRANHWPKIHLSIFLLAILLLINVKK